MVLPAGTQIIGRHFKKFKSGELFKGIETPDDRNVINIDSQSDSIMVLKNPNDVTFSIKLATFEDGEEGDLAVIKYDAEEKVIRINDNWIVHESTIENYSPRTATKSMEHNDSMIKIVLNDNQIEKRGPKTIFSTVGMRFNESKLIKFGYLQGKILFIAFDQK